MELTRKFSPPAESRQAARSQLNLPQDRQLILFGAVASTSAHAEGFRLLQPALHQLAAQGWASKVDLVIFGNNPNSKKPMWLDCSLYGLYLVTRPRWRASPL